MAEHTRLVCTLMLLSDVFCSEWKVDYKSVESICAVRGFPIDIPCSFDYPYGHTVQSVFWAQHRTSFHHGPFVFSSASATTSTKFQYFGDKSHNCSLRIHNINNTDAGEYAFRFTTKTDSWTGEPGIKLIVGDLRIEQSNKNKVIAEGNNVSLTCITNCNGHSHFIWYKNGHHIYEGPSLYWNNISSDNSGIYSCSPKTQPQATSGVVRINVEHGPKRTLVSADPGLEVFIGTDVTLICSTDANPPAKEFTWFKMNSDGPIEVGKGFELRIWKCSKEGLYFCRAINGHGSRNSSVVHLIVKEKSYGKDIAISCTIAAVVVVAVLLTGIAAATIDKRSIGSSCAAKNDQNRPKDSVYVNWQESDVGHSKERGRREKPVEEIVYATVDFNNKTTKNTPQQTGSGNDDSVLYSTVCKTNTATIIS